MARSPDISALVQKGVAAALKAAGIGGKPAAKAKAGAKKGGDFVARMAEARAAKKPASKAKPKAGARKAPAARSAKPKPRKK